MCNKYELRITRLELLEDEGGTTMLRSQKLPQSGGAEKFYTLELGRFLAAAVVMLAHWFGEVNGHSASGRDIFGGFMPPFALAVQYFFVLSGFVMARAHHQDFGKWRAPVKFWWRRGWRIYPVYWLALLIPTYFLWGALKQPYFAFRIISLAPLNTGDFIAPAWSLRYEVGFYLIFGVALLPFIGRWVLALWVALVLWSCAPYGLLTVLHIPHPIWLHGFIKATGIRLFDGADSYFLAGLLAGAISLKQPLSLRVSTVVTVLAVLGMLLFQHDFDWGRSYGTSKLQVMAYALILAALLLGLTGVEQRGGLRLPRFCGTLGALSYPLYITHTAVMLIFSVELQKVKWSLPTLYAICLAGIIVYLAIAWAVTALYDQPIQRGVRRFNQVWAARGQRVAKAPSL